MAETPISRPAGALHELVRGGARLSEREEIASDEQLDALLAPTTP